MPPRQQPEEDEAPDGSFEVSPEVLRQLMASGNSQLVEALQRSLHKMVGQSSGFVEALPAPVRARIEYLAELDGERAELYERYREERRALEEKYDKLYVPLYDKRADVISGEVEAPENETPEGKAAAAEEPDAPAGIPDFWMIALRNAMEEETITDKDAEVLSYCIDVRCERFFSVGEDEDDEGFRLVFSFKENPFFTDKQLVKTYHLNSEEDMMLRKIETSGVHWKPGKDITVKVLKKKPKPGQKAGKPQTKTEKVESFFRWFTEVPEVPDEEDEEGLTREELEALEEDMQDDFGIAEMIKDEVIPKACAWFTGEALADYNDSEEDEEELDYDEDEDGEDSDDEGDEDDEEEDDDSSDGENPAKPLRPAGGKKGKEQPQECKQQ